MPVLADRLNRLLRRIMTAAGPWIVFFQLLGIAPFVALVFLFSWLRDDDA